MDIVAYAYNPTTEEAEAEGSFSTEQNKTDQIVSEDAFSALQLLLLSWEDWMAFHQYLS